jgi:hypothetical protein
MGTSGIRGTYREATLRMVAKRVTCLCGTIQESDGYDGVPFELWFKFDVRGHTVWFNNERHGELLLAWLEGKRIRRSMPLPEHSWLEILPSWMIDAKNREAITKGIRRLLATANQQAANPR